MQKEITRYKMSLEESTNIITPYELNIRIVYHIFYKARRHVYPRTIFYKIICGEAARNACPPSEAPRGYASLGPPFLVAQFAQPIDVTVAMRNQLHHHLTEPRNEAGEMTPNIQCAVDCANIHIFQRTEWREWEPRFEQRHQRTPFLHSSIHLSCARTKWCLFFS